MDSAATTATIIVRVLSIILKLVVVIFRHLHKLKIQPVHILIKRKENSL